MKNEKKLLSADWETAPELDLPETEEYKNGKYTYTRRLYRGKCTLTDDGVTVATVFSPSGEPLFRSFTGDRQLVSQYRKDGKRSECQIENFLRDRGIYRRYCRYNNICFEDIEQERRFWEICDKQSDIRAAAVRERHEKIRKSINDAMLEIRPLPKRFDKWLDDCVMSFSRYIIYTYSGRKLQEGYCTHCKTFVKVEGAKHQKNGKCPNCRSAVKFIASGKAPRQFNDREECTYIQPGRDGKPIFRFFEITRHYYLNAETGKAQYEVRTYADETERAFKGSGRVYRYENFMQTGQFGFCERGYGYATGARRRIYPYNMKAVFASVAAEQKHLKYIPFVKLLKKTELCAERFYDNAIKMPSLEYLVKLNLFSLAADAVNNRREQPDIFNPREVSLKKVFPRGVNRAELKWFSDIDIRAAELEKYYEFGKEIGTKKFLDGIRLARREKVPFDICFELLRHMTADKLVRYAEETVTRINKERPFWNRVGTRYFMRDWLDYVRNAEKLGWDVKDSFILFPRNFSEADDRAASLVKIENAREKDCMIEAAEKSLNKLYAYETKKYLIRAPHNAREIVAEGQALRHCVATYVDRAAEGETTILFMRDKKSAGTPLYTIEVCDGELIQVRGKRNCSIKEKAEQAFFNQWKKVKLNKEKRKAV